MKSLLRTLSITALVMLICVALSPSTKATDFDGKVYITISQPMETPGNVILPAGDYTLKRLDLGYNRNVVEFFSGDGQKLYNTVMTIPEYRVEPAKETHLTFYEQQAGQAAAVRSLVTEGSTIGVEFVYPRARAKQLAMNISSQPAAPIALSESNTTLDPVDTPDVSSSQPASSASDNSASADATPAVAVASADPAPVAEAADADASQANSSDAAAPDASTQSTDPAQAAAPAANDPAATTPSTTLPKTAGEQELVLLLGMGCTAAAFALRKIRQ